MTPPHEGADPDPRPMAWLPPPIPASDGLPPIRTIPDESRLGLSPDQCQLLGLACAGGHVFADGPGGSGKTMVLARYAALRTAQDDASIACITPDRSSALGKWVTLSAPADVEYVIANARAERAAGRATCLIADEHTSVTERLGDEINAFDQVIVTGDPAQGTYWGGSDVARKLMVALGARRSTTIGLWRSHNQEQFNAMNALAYQGRHEAVGWRSAEAPDAMRSLTGPPGTIASFTDLGLRVARNTFANPTSSTCVIVSTREEMCLVLSVLAHIPFKPDTVPRIAFTTPWTLQGTEADVILLATGSLSLARTRREVEELAFVLMGRARSRTELRRPAHAAGERSPDLDAWLADLGAWSFDTVIDPSGDNPHAAFVASLGQSVVVKAGLTHLSIHDAATGGAKELINVLSHAPREDIARAAAAAAKGWKVTTRHPEELVWPLWPPRRSR